MRGELDAGAGRPDAAAGPGPGDLVPPGRAAGAAARHRVARRPSGSVTPSRPSTSTCRPRPARRWQAEVDADPGRSRPRSRGCARGPIAPGSPRPRSSGPRLERLLADEDRALTAARQAVADRREGRVRLQGEVTALRTRATAAEDEIGRLTVGVGGGQGAGGLRARASSRPSRARSPGLDAGEVDLDAAYEAAAAALADAEENVARCRTRSTRSSGPAQRRRWRAATRSALGSGPQGRRRAR